MASREQDAAAELDLEVDELAEEYFLIDARLPDVVSLRPRLGELHVLGTHRENDAVGAAQIVVGQDLDFAELGAHAEMPGLGAAPEDRAVQKIRRSDEVGDELGARPLVDFARRADLLDMALVHHRDRVRERERLALVVGHVDRGDPELALQAFQLEAHQLAQLRVEVGERLIEEQQLRLHDERPREREALLLAARELGRLAVGKLVQLHRRQHAQHLVADFRP